MFNLSDTCKRLILADVICTAVLAAAGLAVILTGYFKNDSAVSFLMGIVFSCVFTVLKLMLMERAVKRSLDMSPEDGKNYMRMHYMNRYFLTGAVVVAAIFAKISLLGVVLGLFALTPAAFIAGKMENAAKENKLKD